MSVYNFFLPNFQSLVYTLEYITSLLNLTLSILPIFFMTKEFTNHIVNLEYN